MEAARRSLLHHQLSAIKKLMLSFAWPVLFLLVLSLDHVQAKAKLHISSPLILAQGGHGETKNSDKRDQNDKIHGWSNDAGENSVLGSDLRRDYITTNHRRKSQLLSMRGGGGGGGGGAGSVLDTLKLLRLPPLSLPVTKILLQLALTVLNIMCWVIPIKNQNFTQNTAALGMLLFT